MHLGRWRGERPLTAWLGRQSGVPPQAQGEGKLYLLDGLDEAVNPQEKQTPQEQQRKLLDAIETDLGAAPFVLSCRLQDYQAMNQHANLDGAVRLLELPTEEVERYLCGRGFSTLWDAALRDHLLMQLLQTPLLLAVATVAWSEAGETREASETAIFNQFVIGRFRHERARSMPLPYDEETTRRRLGDRAGRLDILSEEDNTLAERARDATDEEFSAFAERMHFLQPGISGGRQFLHRKLSDFFALPRLEELASYTQNRRVASWIHFFAEEIGLAAVPLLVGELKKPDENRRQSAIRALATIKDPRVLPALIEASSSGGKYIKRHAEDAIRSFGPAALPALQSAIVGSNDDLAWTATLSVISLGASAAPLVRQLAGHSNPRVRSHALFALRELRSYEALAEVRANLNDQNVEVRATALETLAQLGDGVSAARAAQHALYDSAVIVRQSAAFVCRWPSIVAALTGDERTRTIERLIELLHDEVTVSEQVAKTLVVIGNPDAAAVVEENLIHGRQEIRYALVCELARTPYSSLAESLARVLREDHDALVREYAAYALAKIGGAVGDVPRQALGKAAEHDEASLVRRAAAHALQQLREASSP